MEAAWRCSSREVLQPGDRTRTARAGPLPPRAIPAAAPVAGHARARSAPPPACATCARMRHSPPLSPAPPSPPPRPPPSPPPPTLRTPKTTLVGPPHTRTDAHVSHQPYTAYTGQCDQRAPQQRAQQCFHAWSFDRVVAGEAYAEETVQPLLHRYTDAKYIWSDTSAREWLDGFVRAHDPTVPQAERWFVVGRARGARSTARTGPRRCAASSSTWSWKRVRRPRGPSCSTRHAFDRKAAPACACVRLSPKSATSCRPSSTI